MTCTVCAAPCGTLPLDLPRGKLGLCTGCEDAVWAALVDRDLARAVEAGAEAAREINAREGMGVKEARPGMQIERQCARCGSSIDHRTCEACDGMGVDGHDCGEDCCNCVDPLDNETCGICLGKGGWYVCASRGTKDEPGKSWCDLNPMAGREAIEGGTVERFEVPERRRRTS